MATTIAPERPDTPDAIALITELEGELDPLYPSESRHGYSIEKLLAQGVAFFVVREDGVPVGCGGIQLYGTEYAELKRMYMRPQRRGAGHARLLLDRLAAHARDNGIDVLRLETGVHQQAAIAFYERAGFRSVPPFGQYKPDPLSLFYEKRIARSRPGDSS